MYMDFRFGRVCGQDAPSKLRLVIQFFSLAMLTLALVIPTTAQQTSGNVRGSVKDPTGAVVPNARVTITDKKTGSSQTVQTTSEGEYQFNNLLPADYTLTVEATNFKTLTLNDVRVELNQTTDVPTTLQVGLQGEVVEVSAGGAELVETTTTTLSKSFGERQVVELAQTNVGGAFGGGVNNLALIAPNVSTSGGVGVGTGGSVGGQRPRNNNFMLDGVDNNDKSVTGPSVYVSPENVAEFSLLQNQFSAEFGRSSGGQFITVTKSGTNDLHGSAYGYFRNRYLNALDNLQKISGVTRNRSDGDLFMPRFDYFRGGVNMGGPVYLPSFGEGGPSYWSGKDKLFFFTSYERLQFGSAASAGGITTPTAQGFAVINSQPGLSATNLGIFNRFVPVAPAANDTIEFCRVARVNGECPGGNVVLVPVGNVSISSPNFGKQNHFLLNMDYNQSAATQHRFRFSFTNNATIDNTANLPTFFATIPTLGRLFSYTLLHNITPNLINETRLAYRRSVAVFPVPGGLSFPGLDVFPNVNLLDIGLDIGPNGNAPQGGTENNYQVVNNVTWLHGNHAFKIGADYRRVITPQVFVQRQRGDYRYFATDTFLRDISPDDLAERNVGTSTYIGNQHLLYAFAQDDWRVRPNVTLNLGVNYSYQEVPRGANEQARNAISTVPGLIEFREPKEQLKNFAPKVGLAYSPNFTSGLFGHIFGTSGQSSIRTGFSMSYDYVFDNLYILSSPPQSQQTVGVEPTAGLPNFLANGGIRDVAVPIADARTARGATANFIPDQQVPYSLSDTLSFQRQFMKNYSFEARYLGTRGVHLFTQNRINRQPKVSEALGGLPTFLSQPTQAQLDALGLTLTQINARSNYVAAFDAAGFNGDVIGNNSLTAFTSEGNSTYQAASAQLVRRFSEGFQMTAAYTWSHLIDDTTAEVNSTALSPRRVEDFQNLRRERADSILDRRHRFVLSSIYELPFFKTSQNGLLRALLGGFNFSGTYSLESGQKATVRSGVDSNLNGDAAGDRAIINLNGVRDTFSTVTALRNSAGQVVGYLADNPNAQYIQTGAGALSNAGRNTMQLPGINNLDFSIFKNFRLAETRRIQFRADLFNALNHPQYIPGSTNDVAPINTAGVAQLNTIFAGNTDFNRPQNVFSSNSRIIQLALRLDF